jgi:hypothetical protein
MQMDGAVLMSSRHQKFFAAVLPLCLLAACGDFERPQKPDAPASGVVLVMASDFSTGFLSAIDPSGSRAYRDILPVFQDSSAHYDAGGSSFVLQRLGADSVMRVDHASGYHAQYEISLGSKLNPQSIALLPGGLFAVSFFNANHIDIRSRSSGALVTQINISAYADADGFAEAGDMIYHAGFLYVAVQRLARNATDALWPPEGTSYLLKIDASNYTIAATALTHSNPISRLHYNAARNSIIFAAAGRFAANYQLDGACLEFSVTSGTLLAPLITEAQAGYEIADCELTTGGQGVFIGYDAALNSIFGSFNTSGPAVTGVAAFLNRNNGGYLASFLLHSNGNVYLADRNIFQPGIRIFDGTSLTELTAKTLSVGLPPLSLEEVP